MIAVTASGATIQTIPKQTATITPSFVATLIRFARSKGWQPDAKGPPLHIDVADEGLPLQVAEL